MVYTDCSKASQFRIHINRNFIWDFLNQHNIKHYDRLNVNLIAERFEDVFNQLDFINTPLIRVHTILFKIISEQNNRIS